MICLAINNLLPILKVKDNNAAFNTLINCMIKQKKCGTGKFNKRKFNNCLLLM